MIRVGCALEKRKFTGMAKKPLNVGPMQSRILNRREIERGIGKLEKRIGELNDLLTINSYEELRLRCNEATAVTNETVASIFRRDTAEYKSYEIFLQPGLVYAPSRSDRPYVEGYYKAIRSGIAKLTAAVKVMNERLEDIYEDENGSALRAYENLQLHHEIERAAGQLYQDGHYAQAISTAVVALNDLVRLRSGISDKDGTHLMELVFNPTKPVLRFNDLNDESDRNEQKGFMMMFSGAVVGLRNPRAHKIIHDDPEEALEFIAFISLLAKLIDKAKRA
jgi:uncharacterized protein (TIGR02391 family)